MVNVLIASLVWLILFVISWWGINQFGNRNPNIVAVSYPARAAMEGLEAVALSTSIVIIGCVLYVVGIMSDVAFFAFLIYFIKGGTMNWLLWFFFYYALFWILITIGARRFINKGLTADNLYMRDIPFPLWFHAIIMIFSFFPAWINATLMGWIT